MSTCLKTKASQRGRVAWRGSVARQHGVTPRALYMVVELRSFTANPIPGPRYACLHGRHGAKPRTSAIDSRRTRVRWQSVPPRMQVASPPRSGDERVPAWSWSPRTSIVHYMQSTRSALRPACRAPKRTAAAAAAAASHPSNVSTLRSSQPWRSSHISAGPCDDHRCGPRA